MRLMNYNYCSQDATTITASNINPGFPVSNLKNPFRSKRVRTSDTITTLAVVFDLATTEAIDSVVFLWSKEDGIKLSNTATIKIQANATNVWTSPAVDQTLTVNNTYDLASYFFGSDQSYRYWRVLITDASNPYGYIELGVCWLGKGLTIDNAQNGFQFSLTDKSKVSSTDFGHTYVDEYPQLANIAFNYKTLDYASVQILENAFRLNGISDPVMVALDPTAAVFNKDHFLVYGKFQSSFGFSHINYSLFDSTGLTVVELA